MTKFFTIIFVSVVISCQSNHTELANEEDEIVYTYDKDKVDFSKIKDPYEIDFIIDKVDSTKYALIVSMDLMDGSNYVSPYSKGNYSGIFRIKFEDNIFIVLNDSLIEFPKSVERYDSWQDGPANFVDSNTEYTQNFSVVSDTDFEVSGLVQFTIEPKCTFEEIEFHITYESGKMTVKHNKLEE